QLGWISWYSPIGDNQRGSYLAKPEYYGMLAFGQVARGERLASDLANGGLHLAAYATGDEAGVRVAVVNKDATTDANVTVTCDRDARSGSLMRLTGPSLESKHGIALGGATVGEDGEWQPSATAVSGGKHGEWQIQVPAGSAAL